MDNRHLPRQQLLTEGLNVRDILMDIVQVGVDTGAIAITGGAAGDYITDVLFALTELQFIMDSVTGIVGELSMLGTIIDEFIKFDMSNGLDNFYNFIRQSMIRLAGNNLVGDSVASFLETVQEEVEKLVNKVIRAVSKWVGALIPDDFGLGGPAFEATVTTAVNATTANAYTIASKSVLMLPDKAKNLLLKEEKLQEFLLECVHGVQDYVAEISYKIENPDPEKASLFNNIKQGYQFSAEMYVAPYTGLINLASNAFGGDDVFDSVADDALAVVDSMPSWHPTRKALGWGIPKIEDMLSGIDEQHCKHAAASLQFILKLLFGSLGVLQLAMDEKFIKLLKGRKTKDIFGFGDIDLNIDASDIMENAIHRSVIHKHDLTRLLCN